MDLTYRKVKEVLRLETRAITHYGNTTADINLDDLDRTFRVTVMTLVDMLCQIFGLSVSPKEIDAFSKAINWSHSL